MNEYAPTPILRGKGSAPRFARQRAAFAALAYLAASFSFAQTADLPNRHDALEGITTAGQPSEAALSAIAAAGYKSVIDLRGANEDRGLDERKIVEMLGMSYANLPVEGAAGVSYANASALDKLLAELPKPVLVHCSTGNRAGALLALRAKANGADADAALELGLANGLAGLRPVVEEKLNAATTEHARRSAPHPRGARAGEARGATHSAQSSP